MPSTTSAVTRRSRWCASRRSPSYDEHVRGRDEGVEPDVVVLGPCPRLAGQLVVDLIGLPRLEAEGGHVDVDGRLAHRMRVEVDDDEHAVVALLLRPGEDLLVVSAVPAQVAQLAKGRVCPTNAVEPRQQRGEAAPLSLGRRPVAGAVLYFSLSRYSSLPGLAATCSNSSKPE